jgi:hypothetical protein
MNQLYFGDYLVKILTQGKSVRLSVLSETLTFKSSTKLLDAEKEEEGVV